MKTRFEKIPDIFYRIYREQFHQWAREFTKRGVFAAIVFNDPPGVPLRIGEDGNPVWRGAWFEAGVEKTHVGEYFVIRPRTERDEDLVARHAHEMAPHWLS